MPGRSKSGNRLGFVRAVAVVFFSCLRSYCKQPSFPVNADAVLLQFRLCPRARREVKIMARGAGVAFSA